MQRINWPSGAPRLIRDSEIGGTLPDFVDLREEDLDLEIHNGVDTLLSQQVNSLLPLSRKQCSLVGVGQDVAVFEEAEWDSLHLKYACSYFLFVVSQEERDLLVSWVAERKAGSVAATTAPKTLEELYRLHSLDDASVEVRRAALRAQYGFQNN